MQGTPPRPPERQIGVPAKRGPLPGPRQSGLEFLSAEIICRLRRTGASLNSGRFPLNPEVVFRPSIDDEVRQSSLEAHPPRSVQKLESLIVHGFTRHPGSSSDHGSAPGTWAGRKTEILSRRKKAAGNTGRPWENRYSIRVHEFFCRRRRLKNPTPVMANSIRLDGSGITARCISTGPLSSWALRSWPSPNRIITAGMFVLLKSPPP